MKKVITKKQAEPTKESIISTPEVVCTKNEPNVLETVQEELPPRRQIELADFDIEILNAGQYSEKAWEAVGRRHKADPTTRLTIEGSNGRGFLMCPKNWPPLPPPKGVPVTTQNVNNILNEFGQNTPIQADGNMAGVRAALLSRDLTKPVSEETYEEEV